MGGHYDESASTGGIVAGCKDDGMQNRAVRGENLHKFRPGHPVNPGLRPFYHRQDILDEVKGQTEDVEVASIVGLPVSGETVVGRDRG